MNAFFSYCMVALILVALLSFYRVARGPTVFDRLLALSALGGKTIGLVCLFGVVYGRLDMFIDIALAYAILNFIGGIALAKFFAAIRRDHREPHWS